MFKNLPTGTKLFVLCGTFLISIAVPIYGLVTEKRLAIDFSRKELVGSRYFIGLCQLYAALLAQQPESADVAEAGPAREALLASLAPAQAGAWAQAHTSQLADAFAAALRQLWSTERRFAEQGSGMLDALFKGQALAARIGDDANLALDPDLDTYYLQNIVVRHLPTFVARLAELQEFFASSVLAKEASAVRDARLSALVGLVRSTATELKESLEAAYRGNADGRLRPALDTKFIALISSIQSYIAVLAASTTAVDTRDAVAPNRLHASTIEHALKAWTAARAELDRLLQVRIDGLLTKMLVELALIGTFAGLSIFIALLTHRHIVQPLKRLESVASEVRSSKNYNLRANHGGKDEIGRVTVAFNDMLAELAAARARETAERGAFAQATRLTTMGEMAASIAHEVNQPLAAIVANANAGLRWLANAAPDLGKVQTILQRVVRDGHRASEVIGSVRAMLKRDVQQKAPVAVNALIDEVVGLLQTDLEREQISLQLELGSGSASVLADRVQLQQVILNLITNAIDAMRASQHWPRVLRISTATGEANSWLISVQDAGAGIDPKHRERIFEPFYTTKASGMGLGLSICRSIIEAHGGRLWAEPAHPRGTTFQFMLPANATGLL